MWANKVSIQTRFEFRVFPRGSKGLRESVAGVPFVVFPCRARAVPSAEDERYRTPAMRPAISIMKRAAVVVVIWLTS